MGTTDGRRERPEWLPGLFQLSPMLIMIAVLVIVPVSYLLVYGFWSQDGFEIDRSFTLENYARIFTDPDLLGLLGKSLLIAFASTISVIVLAYPAAYFLAFSAGRYKLLLLIVITLPFWTSYLIRIFSWKVVLGYQGAFNSGLMALGLIDQPLTFLLYNPAAVVITLSHAWAPFALLPIFVSLEKIDRTLISAARDLGDSAAAAFWRVTLPLSMPGVIAAFTLVFIPTVGDYITPQLVGGRTGTMIGTIVQLQFGELNNWPLGAAISIVSMLVVTVSIIGVVWLMGRLRS